jgi:hypothetical protein
MRAALAVVASCGCTTQVCLAGSCGCSCVSFLHTHCCRSLHLQNARVQVPAFSGTHLMNCCVQASGGGCLHHHHMLPSCNCMLWRLLLAYVG